MTDYLTVTAPGAAFTPRLIPVTGDRLVHPADRENELARIVIRWGRGWIAETQRTRDFFKRVGTGEGDPPRYGDRAVLGWLFLSPQKGSLAEKVRSGEIDIATALSVEAEAWPES